MADVKGVQIVVKEKLRLEHTGSGQMLLEGNYIAIAVTPSHQGAQYALHKANAEWKAEGDRIANVALKFDGNGGVAIS